MAGPYQRGKSNRSRVILAAHLVWHGYGHWLPNAHAVVRTHRDRSEVIWDALAHATREAARSIGGIAPAHPVWSHRPYKVYLYTPEQVVDRIDYVLKNPEKEGLARQSWWFVKPYQGK